MGEYASKKSQLQNDVIHSPYLARAWHMRLGEIRSRESTQCQALCRYRPANTGMFTGAGRELDSLDRISFSSSVHSVTCTCTCTCMLLFLFNFR